MLGACGYLDDDDDRRWEAPLARIDHEEQSAFALGYDIGAIADTSHRALVNRFLPTCIPNIREGAEPRALDARKAPGWKHPLGPSGT